MRPHRIPLPLLAAVAFSLLVGAGETASAAKSTAERAISVEWRRDVWQPPEVRTMDENGGNKLVVAKDLWRGGAPRWSPDGLRLGGYQKRIGDGPLDFAIADIRADGADERLLLAGPEFDAYNVARGHKSLSEKFSGSPFGVAAWNPDGRALVFAGRILYEGVAADPYDDKARYRLFTVSLDGTKTIAGVTPDVEAAYADHDPHWSWVLDKIVFVRTPDTGQAQLWAVNPDGTGLEQLTSFSTASLPSGKGPGLAAPVWSHEGTRIAFVGGLEGGPTYSGDLWTIDYTLGVAATTATVVRGEQGVREWQPAWSPGDDRLVYVRSFAANSREDRFQIAILNVATGSQKIIVDQNKQAVLNPDWNPVVPVPSP
jgi:Tol biopolymer transport system component